MWEGNCDSSAIITFELLSTTRFFRGKLSVRCYPPVSVPRVGVKRIPIRPPAAASLQSSPRCKPSSDFG